MAIVCSAKSTLYVLIGVSGSGKSAYAEKMCQNTKLKVVSTDAIRKEILGSESDQKDGWKIFREAYARLNGFLARGKDVVFDATNTTRKGRADLLKNLKAPCLKVAVLVITPLDVAIERNAGRVRRVPESVIRRQYDQLIRDGESIPNQFDEIIFLKDK